MQEIRFHHPTKIIFGLSTIKQVGKETKILGDKVCVVVTGKAMEETGILNKVERILKDQKLEVEIFNEIISEPKIEEIQKGAKFALSKKSKVIIGLGGGSAIDAAKAIAVGAHSGKNIEHFLQSDESPTSALPVVAVPTTAGTGSELSRSAILSDAKTGIKKGLRSDALVPRVAIVDPELTLSVPPKITALTGFDALSHAIETFISKQSNFLTEMLSREAIFLIYHNLPIVVRNGGDLTARSKMSFASMIMGYNLVYSRNCLPHRIQYAMGMMPNMTHAQGLAALYPAWIDKALEVVPSKFQSIAKIIGMDNKELLLNNWPERFRENFNNFMLALGLETHLSDFEIQEEIVDKIADRVSGELQSDPTFQGEKTITDIIKKSL